jgi:hypothetical protein
MLATAAPLLLAAGDGSFWAVSILVVVAVFGIVVLLRILARLASMEASVGASNVLLENLAARLKKLEAERADIDLRRTEHVLIDIRDGLKGLEDAVIEAASRPTVVEREIVTAPDAPAEPPPDAADIVGERLHNRLAALGYDRVQLLGEHDLYEMAALGRAEIPVEARRNGVVHKGRCIVEKGRVLDVRMDPPYRLFP